MGIVRVLSDAVKGNLADQWLEIVEPQWMDNQTLMTSGVVVRKNDKRGNNKGSEGVISNGSMIHVNPDQFMLIVQGGKIVDYSAEPGYYKVEHSAQPSLFNGDLSKVVEETFGRFKFGGIPGQVQKVYYINLQEIRNIKFGTRNPVNYFDPFYNAELFLRAHGSYSIKIVDPLKFFAEMIASNQDLVKIQDIQVQYSAEFMTAFQSAVNQLSVDQVRVSYVASRGMELSSYLSTVLDEEWIRKRGVEVLSVGIDSISYSEESQKLIHLRNQGAMLENPAIREGYIQASVARGVENAGSNEAGAIHGFMGLGIGMQGAGSFVKAASESNHRQMQAEVQQQMQQQMQEAARQEKQQLNQGRPPTVTGQWTCECGVDNQGRFCTECGQSMSVSGDSKEWVCPCGTNNTGKFCIECGLKRPEAYVIQCDKCGTVPAQTSGLKFCPECGDPINEADYIKT